MEKKEFCLIPNKVFYIDFPALNLTIKDGVIRLSDVKEFIRLLNETVQDGDDELIEIDGINYCNWDLIVERLEKLIGENLRS